MEKNAVPCAQVRNHVIAKWREDVTRHGPATAPHHLGLHSYLFASCGMIRDFQVWTPVRGSCALAELYTWEADT